MLRNHSSDPRFTYGDYVQWQGDERWELIDGEAYLMSPAPSRRHQLVIGELHRQIANFLVDQACEIYVAPFDVRLPETDETDGEVATVVQPDLAVICDPQKLDDAGCRGAPDWIVEILSPSTTVRDQVHKRDLYERHGVREYWIVHPTEQTLLAFRLDPASEKFQPATTEPARGSRRPATFPDLEIDWTPVFAG